MDHQQMYADNVFNSLSKIDGVYYISHGITYRKTRINIKIKLFDMWYCDIYWCHILLNFTALGIGAGLGSLVFCISTLIAITIFVQTKK